MCSRVTCPTCHKPTYAGCGAHIEMVLGDVPKDQRCRCREARAVSPQPTARPTSPGRDPSRGSE